MKLKMHQFPDNTVYRELFAGGERAWRQWHSSRKWDYCADHKGPWVRIFEESVPEDIRWFARISSCEGA